MEQKVMDNLEKAKLKLALLKENFEFQEFYKLLKSDSFEICPELRRPNEPFDDFIKRLFEVERGKLFCFGNAANKFFHLNVNEYFILQALKEKITLKEIIEFLDPEFNPPEDMPEKMKKLLINLFEGRGVQKLNMIEGSIQWDFHVPDRDVKYKRLAPYERIIKIDLRKRKSQLEKEFKKIVEHEINTRDEMRDNSPKLFDFMRKYGLSDDFNWLAFFNKFIKAEVKTQKEGGSKPSGLYFFKGNYVLWDFDSSSIRKETWQQLKIWKMRKGRPKKTFREIARDLDISEDLAKKSFYNVWEKIFGTSYDKEKFNELLKHPYKYCSTCEDEVCKENLKKGFYWNPCCPEIEAHLYQKRKPYQETQLHQDYESFISKDYTT
jgi:hypothetical protein